MINDLVIEVGTGFPKKVYISPEVNASVFYDSSFWSMFLPIKKNLVIGLGLVNIVTKEELKAIMAHEFGHFSQRTMKVGSYVYNVNQVIFNMLYDNESYEGLAQSWANVSGYFSIFVAIALKINEGVQWILKKLYELVNKSYMGLSREMEFHADEIAASIAGYEPLRNSLLRMGLADNSYNNVLNFYNSKVTENIKSENIYLDQLAVLNFLSETNRLTLKNNLPNITLKEQSKYDKSKLTIKNQWASHPSIKERIYRLEKTGFISDSKDDKLANELFREINELQKKLTHIMFEAINYEGDAICISTNEFIEKYKSNIVLNSFSNIYNSYYDDKNPVGFELSIKENSNKSIAFSSLFSDEKVDWVYTSIALQNDIATIKKIYEGLIPIKTFDYDGNRYRSKDSEILLGKLQSELSLLNEKISSNDYEVYCYFSNLEVKQNKQSQLKNMYTNFFSFDKTFDTKFKHFIDLSNELHFVSVTTPFEQIKSNFEKLRPIEDAFKQEIELLLVDEILKPEITLEIRNNLEKYNSKTWEYFEETSYFEKNLELLYEAMQNYSFLLSRKYFLMKKTLLSYQEELLKSQE